ncbi:MAG: DedA family protein [Chloroflexi bacterium]|nr:DedA family protein [Chloroflexota bacterium]
MAFEEFLAGYGLAAIFCLMLVKGIGIPVPIPADLIMLTAAAQVALGRFVLWQAFLVILVAMVAGGSAQFFLARILGRRFLYRVGRYIGLTAERLDRVSTTMRKSGPVSLAIILVTPGVRTAGVPAAGLAGLSYATFLAGATLGSAAFLTLHFAIGYLGGTILGALTNAATMPMLLALFAFALIGLAGWMFLRRRTSNATLERVGDFVDAACPVCLAIGTVEHFRSTANASVPSSP